MSASPELMHYMANLAQAHVADADSLSRQFANLDDEQVLKSLGVDNNPKEAMLALYQVSSAREASFLVFTVYCLSI